MKLWGVAIALLAPAAHATTMLLVSPTGAATPIGAYIRADIGNCVSPVSVATGLAIPSSRQFPLNGASSVTLSLEDNTTGISCGGLLLSYYTFTYVANGTQTSLGSVQLAPGNVALASLFPLSSPPIGLNLAQGSVSASVACGVSGCTLTDSGLSVLNITTSASSVVQITSFTGCNGALELGTSVINPTCVASYSGTPASAVITNSDGVGSPLTLTSPFTSGTIMGTLVHTSTATNTVTLTANGSTTATQTYTWSPAIFGGLGAAGATATVTASGTTAILSTGAALSRIQLGPEAVNSVLGPYVASGQTVYLLLLGGSHTFIDSGTGFPFAFNAPIPVSFVNAHGVTVTMYLYGSSNALYGTFNIKVAS